MSEREPEVRIAGARKARIPLGSLRQEHGSEWDLRLRLEEEGLAVEEAESEVRAIKESLLSRLRRKRRAEK